jgi:two-component system invasion response regulator UvrY
VVLLDLDMPGRDTLEVIRELAAADPSVRVVVLSGLLNPPLVNRVLAAGAWGYLSKGETSGEIVEAVRRVASDEPVLGPEARTVYGPARLKQPR